MHEGLAAPTSPSRGQTHIRVMPATAFSVTPAVSAETGAAVEVIGALQLKPSPLRPTCKADQRIFQWRGVNTPPPSTYDHPLLQVLANQASQASLKDTASYGSGLRKFHLFCDVFSIPEADRLPASFKLLHSFVLWTTAEPDPNLGPATEGMVFEPVAVSVARKYLAAVRAWHLAQGWPAPLKDDDMTRINWSLRGIDNIGGGKRKRPPRPPVTVSMLSALKTTLELDKPFDACIWAIAACGFWGMMRFGEVSVNARSDFTGTRHLKRSDVIFAADERGNPYARLDLPSAKTAKPGEIQHVYLVQEGHVCPLDALRNLARVVPAAADDPLFSWRDSSGEVRPMVKARALERINSILQAWGWGNAFGHSFRIGGASLYLARKVDPEIVRLAGRWKSLAYEAYIRAFEQIASQHMANVHIPRS